MSLRPIAQALLLSLAILTAPTAAQSGCFTGVLRAFGAKAPAFSAVAERGVLDAASTKALCGWLGLPADSVEFHYLSAGGLNEVYTLKSKNPSHEVYFPHSVDVDPRLHGKRIDNYVLKIAKPEIDASLQRRDLATLGAIQNALSKNAEYEGIHLADTIILPQKEGSPRLIVQKRSTGREMFSFLKPLLEPALGEMAPHEYDDKAQQLFSHLIEAELIGAPVDQIFSTANLTDKNGQLVYKSPEDLKRIRDAWTQVPDVVRVRELIKQLYKLSRSPELHQANRKARLTLNILMSNMPWTSGRSLLKPTSVVLDALLAGRGSFTEIVNGDFSARNFFLVRDERGQLHVELVDF